MTTHHPLGYCPKHGLFAATGFAFGDAVQDAQLIGNKQTCPHPQCSRTCEIISGRYSTWGGQLNLLLDPSVSPEALEAIKEIARKAQAGEYSAEEARAEAEKVAPKAGKLFDVANWSDQAKATLYASIIGAVAVVAAARMASSTSTQVDVQPIVERVIERRFDEFSTSTSIRTIPTPTPRPKEPPKERP